MMAIYQMVDMEDAESTSQIEQTIVLDPMGAF